MANFCSRCGRPLQEGELCSCQATVAPPQLDEKQATPQEQIQQQDQPQIRAYQPPVHPAQQFQPPTVPLQQQPQPYVQPVKAPSRPNAFLKYLNLLWECLKAYFKDASNTLRLAAAHKDLKTGFTYAGINSILIGLFLMASCYSFSLVLTQGISSIASYFGSYFKMSGLSEVSVGIPYFLVFLFAFLLSAAAYFAICATGLIIGSIMGKKPSFKALIASIGVSSLPATLLMAAAIICNFIWAPLGMLLAAAALFTWIISTYTAMKVTFDVQDSKLSIYYGLLTAIVIGIILVIGARFAPFVLGHITVSGESLTDILSSF